MDDLVSRRRAIAGRADLRARIAGRQPTRDERRLLDHYDRTLGAVERRDAIDASEDIMRWLAQRNERLNGRGISTRMTDDERLEFRALVAEHRALSGRHPRPGAATPSSTPALDLRRRRSALLIGD